MANTAIQTTSTSSQSATCSDIILRDGPLIRLLFRPQIVNNPNDQSCSVRGIFIYQRRKKGEPWQDANEESLNKLKSGEGYKLEISSAEVKILTEAIANCYKLYEQHGIRTGENEFILTTSNVSSIIGQLLSDPTKIEALIEQGDGELILPFLNWFGKVENKSAVLGKLETFDVTNLLDLNTIIGITALKRLWQLWQINTTNDNEEYWHRVFKNNSWALSQIFASPVVLVNDKAYIGGKSISNSGGNIVDFLYQNKFTGNCCIVEIKTPTTELIGKEYRSKTFSPSGDLSGSVAQVLSYRDNFIKDSERVLRDNSPLTAYSPRCIVVIGSLAKIGCDSDKLRSFELFRADLKNVEVITFDEIFEKISILIGLLQDGLNTDCSENELEF